jgi:hypothetical protein
MNTTLKVKVCLATSFFLVGVEVGASALSCYKTSCVLGILVLNRRWHFANHMPILFVSNFNLHDNIDYVFMVGSIKRKQVDSFQA